MKNLFLLSFVLIFMGCNKSGNNCDFVGPIYHGVQDRNLKINFTTNRVTLWPDGPDNEKYFTGDCITITTETADRLEILETTNKGLRIKYRGQVLEFYRYY